MRGSIRAASNLVHLGGVIDVYRSTAGVSTGLGLVDPHCTLSMWKGESLMITAVLALGVWSEVYAGTQMKISRGFSDVVASIKAVLASCVCVACCIQLLSHVELSIGWAFYNAFELAGIAIVGIVVEGEVVTWTKLGGFLAVLTGTVLFEIRAHGREHEVLAKMGEDCQVTLNLVLVTLVLLLVLLPIYWRAKAANCVARGEGDKKRLTTSVDIVATRLHGWARMSRVYGCLVLAATGEVVLAICMKEAAGFVNKSFVTASFILAVMITFFTILALQHSSLVSGWMLFTAFEYIGVQSVAVSVYADEMDVLWKMASLQVLLGILLLVVEEERDLND
mmetsp:Transcript_35085/g.88444  ORF Transcript_35085/g.88444 Transcript_35085/m.88444 type:complete len:336 (-) Transcript_35085:20-1027(-)